MICEELNEVVAELKSARPWTWRARNSAEALGRMHHAPEGARSLRIKSLELKPRAAFSLPMRAQQQDAAHWIVVSGEAQVTSGEQAYSVRDDDRPSFSTDHDTGSNIPAPSRCS